MRRRSSRSLRVLFVPRANRTVEIPAGVVERLRQALDVHEVQPAEVEEADDHVGDLDTGVVDVVLDFRLVTQNSKGPGEDVAQHGIAEVADVRRLVRVDVRVFDDDLPRPAVGRRRDRRRVKQRGGEADSVEVEIHVAWPLDGHPLEAGRQVQVARQLLRDRPWRLPQRSRQVQGAGTRKISQSP